MNKLKYNTMIFTFLTASSLPVGAATINIFSEDFSGGSAALENSTTVTWADTSGGAPGVEFEVYNTSGAGVRGMSGTFDHDQNASTPQITLPGGLEVNDDLGNEILTATFVLNTAISSGQLGSLTFFGGVRGGNSSGASIEIFNITQGTPLTGLLTPTLGTFEWAYNEFNFASTAANIGDSIEFNWRGGGSNSANGQEIALVGFSIIDNPSSVPAPAAIWLVGIGLFGMRKKLLKAPV